MADELVSLIAEALATWDTNEAPDERDLAVVEYPEMFVAFMAERLRAHVVLRSELEQVGWKHKVSHSNYVTMRWARAMGSRFNSTDWEPVFRVGVPESENEGT